MLMYFDILQRPSQESFPLSVGSLYPRTVVLNFNLLDKFKFRKM
jgi:hypothetical protein